MKTFLFISALFVLTSHSCFASCLIDDIDTACSVAGLRAPLNNSFSQDSHTPDLSDNPDVKLKPPENKITSQLRDFGQQPSDFSYNSSCQFGVCNQTGAPKLFNQR